MTTTHDDDNRHRDNATTQEPRHNNTAQRDTTLAMYYDTMDKTPRRHKDHTTMKNHGTTRHDSSHILRHDGQDITAAQRPHHDVTTPQRCDHNDATSDVTARLGWLAARLRRLSPSKWLRAALSGS
ncbi:hypothetical protein K443DRAFT_15308 [Laccaria amethystina LaAM-08-1]|uniref:Uncharacterized protein n=1 Tax=Laccaria amethystina LaAM-08-1 TaxID=1095629 RepID=A0A0C9WR83_9AGAR|nr:hypothetical protein K443DRAFT_15308 [Laccaria amethystina LaAM-08-1]